MDINQLIEKFIKHNCYLEMGAGKIAKQFNSNIDDVIKSKIIAKNKLKYGTEYNPKDVAFKSKPILQVTIKKDTNNNAKILLFDLETSPIISYHWGTRKQFIQPENIIRDWTILTYAGKFLNEDIMYSGTAKDEEEFDDFNIVSELWGLLDKCDILVAHNLIGFDRKKLNARFLFHGMNPPSPYKLVDTLQIAKTNFGTTYHKLDYLSKFIGSSGKMEHFGFDLWKKCMDGDEASWETMLAYNKKDVIELEKIYLELRPWDNRSPSISIFQEDPSMCCTKCGSKNIVYKKDVYTNTREFKLYQCNDCNGWSRSRSSEGKIKALMTQ